MRWCWWLGIVLTTVTLSMQFAAGAFAHPASGIVVNPKGEVFFIHTGRGVCKIDAQGKLTYIHKDSGGHWMALNTDGKFSTQFPRLFQRITGPGVKPALLYASGGGPLVVNRDGNLYYGSGFPGGDDKAPGFHTVTRLSPDGKRTLFAPQLKTTLAELNEGVMGLATCPDGSLYVACPNAILKVTMDGIVTTLVHPVVVKDCDDDLAKDSHTRAFHSPYLRGLDVTAEGMVYAAVTGCRCVVKVTPEGKVETVLKSERPWTPTGVAVRGKDVFVLEYVHSDNHKDWAPRVRKLGPDGKVTILATPAHDKNNRKPRTVYDADPAHLWNRLHNALFVRTASDGKSYGQDELDPLLWPKSKFLLAGEHHKRVVSLLDEFLAKEGHKLIKDPLKRVVLQHDLWAVFDWLANPTAPYQYREDDFPPEARALQVRLAKAIRRLALSAEEVQRLPDNYAAAVTAKAFAASYDPEKPERAFLPADLFDPDGPWVLLGEHMAPAAPVHVRAVHGRSAFFVLMNLPAGRKATLAYLEKLGAFPNALMPQPVDRNAKFLAKNLPRFNPELPQFPLGTQVALARELLVIDDRAKIKPTRLIESVQFRVYREIPKGDAAHPEGFDDLVGKQDFYEFRITRKNLFAGIAGGLHAVGPRDEEITVFLNPPADDLLEENPPVRPGRIMGLCAGCHDHPPGIHSVEAYRRSFIHLPQPAHLREYDRSQQERAAMLRKWDNYSWGLLQGLMERE